MTVPSSGSQSPRERVPGLDTLRFVCAMWVVFAHLPFLRTNTWLGKDHPGELILRGILNNLFCGPAAVMVFFVISGFCIHFPQRNGRPLALLAFYAQRFVRIGVPFAVAVVLGFALNIGGLQIRWTSFLVGAEHRAAAELASTILWSLVAEMVYYAIYPALRLAAIRISWKGVFVGACLLALAVLMTDPQARYFPHFGNSLTPWIGLPSWLLGVLLAERFQSFKDRPVTRRSLWTWRLGVAATGSGLQALFFHPPSFFPYVGYPWTLQFFSVLAFLWLEREIRWWRQHPPPALLEWAGTWSYSIYLLHIAAPMATNGLLQGLGQPAVSPHLIAPLRILMVFPVCYLFAVLVEHPSWRLARRLGAKLRTQPAAHG